MFSDSNAHSFSEHKFKHVFGQENVVSYPFKAKVGSIACEARQCSIRWSTSLNLQLKTTSKAGVQSTVSCLQLICDKSQTSLSANSLKFFPLRVTLLNIAEEHWR